MVYALLPNKLKTHMKNFLAAQSNLKKVVIDFEAAVRNAIKKMQKTNFVFFQQAVWCNVKKLGFTPKYMEDDEFRLSVKKNDLLFIRSR